MPQMPKNKHDLTVIKQVMALKEKSLNELDKLWRKMFDHSPAFRTKQYMLPKLAYRIQELAYGGIDAGTEQKLIAGAGELDKPKSKVKKYSPMIGTKIVKEYKGKIHEVLVVEEGFAYGGTIFNSLSAVAQKITGTKWNGLKFFNVGDV
ncbi:MAG: DUF2924 domain-containing protein [Holosporaceae bacterium]|jgi:hypothetical protein|nr:DUF2924 domain-containing protein [Holosporaceae bacterium]